MQLNLCLYASIVKEYSCLTSKEISKKNNFSVQKWQTVTAHALQTLQYKVMRRNAWRQKPWNTAFVHLSTGSVQQDIHKTSLQQVEENRFSTSTWTTRYGDHYNPQLAIIQSSETASDGAQRWREWNNTFTISEKRGSSLYAGNTQLDKTLRTLLNSTRNVHMGQKETWPSNCEIL